MKKENTHRNGPRLRNRVGQNIGVPRGCRRSPKNLREETKMQVMLYIFKCPALDYKLSSLVPYKLLMGIVVNYDAELTPSRVVNTAALNDFVYRWAHPAIGLANIVNSVPPNLF